MDPDCWRTPEMIRARPGVEAMANTCSGEGILAEVAPQWVATIASASTSMATR